MLLHYRLILVAASQDATMDLGMQSLNPAVHHFWKAGVCRNFYSWNILLREQLIGAPSGEYLDVKFMKSFCEGNNASLVGDANQCTTNGSRFFCCHRAIFCLWA